MQFELKRPSGRFAPVRLPGWFRQEVPRDISLVKNRIREFEQAGLHTVCKSARCPNLGGCFERNSVTFMIMGDSCSRNCSFCAVSKSRPRPLDLSEPYKLALTIRKMGLEYIVLTSVTRDDLAFGGASHYARCTRLIQSLNPGKKIELLIPDFRNDPAALELSVRLAGADFSGESAIKEALRARLAADPRVRDAVLHLDSIEVTRLRSSS